MPPFDMLFSSADFWTAVIVALVGGGGVGAIVGAVSSHRKDTADIAAQACDILTDSVITPLRSQLDSHMTELRKDQTKAVLMQLLSDKAHDRSAEVRYELAKLEALGADCWVMDYARDYLKQHINQQQQWPDNQSLISKPGDGRLRAFLISNQWRNHGKY